MDRNAPDDALWRADRQQFVVHGLVDLGLLEEIPNRNQHFPLGATEVEEWEGLTNLDIEP